MNREINRYTCVDESGGRRTVIEYQHFSTFRPISGRPSKIAGIKSYRLADGRAVTWVDEKTFQNVETNELLMR